MFAGKFLTDEEVRLLIQEAKMFQDSHFWRYLKDDMLSQTSFQLFNHAKTIDDMVFGKAMLYTIEKQSKKIEEIAAL